MNKLAKMWAKRQIERQQARELQKIAAELRELNRKVMPLREEVERRRKERMRMDGGRGFVMKDGE